LSSVTVTARSGPGRNQAILRTIDKTDDGHWSLWHKGPLDRVSLERLIKSVGPRGVRRAQVTEALTRSWPTQLETVHGFLTALRLTQTADFRAEAYLGGHAIDDPALPLVFRSDPRGSAVKAIALDHSSPAWAALVARQDLYDFGEPPCLVRAEPGGNFLGSDPPVSLQFFDEGTNLAATVGGREPWIDVPTGAGAGVDKFIGWAREHVGRAGRPVSERRRPLRGEVDDEPAETHETNFIGWPYRLARQPTARIVLEARTPIDWGASPGRDWLDHLRESILLGAAAAYRAGGGQAASSAYGTFGEPNQMLLSVRSPRKGTDDLPIDIDTEWRKVAQRLRAGHNVNARVQVCDPLGFASGYRFGEITIDIQPATKRQAVVTTNISFPLLTFVGGAAVVVDTVRTAITTMHMSLLEATVGRTRRRQHWISALSGPDVRAIGGQHAILRSRLFDRAEPNDDGSTLLLATNDPNDFSSERAAAVSSFLAGSR
jgi:hypothetical protein